VLEEVRDWAPGRGSRGGVFVSLFDTLNDSLTDPSLNTPLELP
jgi:hypothetical protein